MLQINKTSLRSALLLGGATAAAIGLYTPAQAQTATVETVVVTGSRIPQRGIEGTSPVTTVGAQEVKLQGATSIGQLLSILPSTVEDGDGDSVDNGTGGIATVDLRNLGTKRTLVLVDGKRLVAADSSLNVDTNVIPAGMVERVEVLTGGDSAVYGSDAVAGVVNIILKKDFEGLQVDSQLGETDNSDGFKSDSYALLGMNSGDGKGNVTIYGEYMHRDPVAESARPYGAHALASTNYTGCASPATHFGGFCFSGSGTIPDGRVKTAALGGTDPVTGLPMSGPTSECITKGVHVGCTTMFTTAGGLTKYDGRTFNFAPFQFYQTQGERYSFGGEGHYQITSNIDFYTRLTFAENSNTSQLGPSPLTTNFDINCGNPLLSSQERQVLFGNTVTAGTTAAQCATVAPAVLTTAANGNAGVTDPNKFQRLVSFALRLSQDGPRITSENHDMFQFVGGFKGDIGWGDWGYDVSGQYGSTNQSQVLFNDALKGNFQNGLLVDPTTGNCYVGGTCVPLNVFVSGGISPAGVNYIRENLLLTSTIKQWDVQAIATGTLGNVGLISPWAKEPVGMSIGTEYRQEAASTVPDNNLATGNLVGFQSSATVHGEFDVAEGFTEVSIPVVQDMPWAEDLTIKGAYRFSAYDRAGDTSTYRGAVQYQPIDDFKLRASYDRAVRAPNVSELFTPAGGSSANSGRDPCSASSSVTTTAALCIATGVPAGSVFSAGLNCPTNQCQGATGGNPFLKPEVATTRSVGVVLTPSFIENFSATIDYYDIKIGGFITATPIQTILNNCYSTALNPTQSAADIYCTFVHRDALGSIADQNAGFVVQAEGNIGQDHVRGIDFELNYATDVPDFGWGDIGGLSFNYRSTWVMTNTSIFPGAPALKCVGVWGPQCGEPENRYKGNLRVTWTDPNDVFSVSLLWRYLSGVQFEQNRSGFVNVPTLEIPDYNYIDLAATWNLSDTIALRGGVRNLLGKNPPLTDNNTAPASDINGNTFPNTYDALGRVIFIGATKKL